MQEFPHNGACGKVLIHRDGLLEHQKFLLRFPGSHRVHVFLEVFAPFQCQIDITGHCGPSRCEQALCIDLPQAEIDIVFCIDEFQLDGRFPFNLIDDLACLVFYDD